MENITDIIKKVIGGMNVTKNGAGDSIEETWKKVLTGEESMHVNFIGIKDNVIFACVDSPAWMYQMKIKKYKILEKLKKENPGIKNISFKIGKVK